MKANSENKKLKIFKIIALQGHLGGRWGGWVKQLMGIKDSACDEHQVVYGNVKSLNCTPETNITLYVNWNLNKNLK